MEYELRQQVIEPRRKTFQNLVDRYGDKPASRYLEASIDIQPTENFHYRPLWEPESTAEGFKRLTWEIAEGQGGVCTLTVTHELEGAPKTRYMVTGKDPNAGGGWPFMLEDLKRLLETGTAQGTGGA